MHNALTSEQVHLIASSLEAVGPKASDVIDRFYNNLFAAAPGVRPLFPQDMSEQKRHLLAAVKLVGQHAGRLDTLADALRDMGARHVDYGAQAAHYPVVRDVLLGSFGEVAGPAWTEPLHDAWKQALNVVAGYMIEGAANARSEAA